MLDKKIIMLTIILSFLLAVSSVCGADNSTGDVVSVEDESDCISAGDAVGSDVNETVASSESQIDEDIISADNGSGDETVKTDNGGDMLSASDCEQLGDGKVHYMEESSYSYVTYDKDLTLKFKSTNYAEKANVYIYKDNYEAYYDYWDICEVKVGNDGYYSMKLNLDPAKYTFVFHDYDDDSYMGESYVVVQAYYGPAGYKNMRIGGGKSYYGQDKDYFYGWDGKFNGYLKIYKGNSLVYKDRLDNRDDGSVKPGEYGEVNSEWMSVGTYKVKIIDANGNVVAQSTIKVVKTPTKVKAKSVKVKPGSKKYVTATVYDKSDGMKHWGGKVKFKIMGKTYNAKVKNGVAKVKIRFPSKAKTYVCKATFLGDKTGKKSSTKFKIIVKGQAAKKKTTKKKTAKRVHKYSYKAYSCTITHAQYKKIKNARNGASVKAKNTGKKWVTIKTYYMGHYKGLKTYSVKASVYSYSPSRVYVTWYCKGCMLNDVRIRNF